MSVDLEYVWNWLGDRAVFFCRETGDKKDVLASGSDILKMCCSILKIDDQNSILYIKLNEKANKHMHDSYESLQIGLELNEIMSVMIGEDIDVVEVIDTMEESDMKEGLRDLLQ